MLRTERVTQQSSRPFDPVESFRPPCQKGYGEILAQEIRLSSDQSGSTLCARARTDIGNLELLVSNPDRQAKKTRQTLFSFHLEPFRKSTIRFIRGPRSAGGPPMNTSDRFLRFAAECEVMAKFSRSPENRTVWSGLAQRWQRCAELLEHQYSYSNDRTRSVKHHSRQMHHSTH